MLKFSGMKTEDAERLWRGEADDHGNPPEVATSNGAGNPCRHCLKMIEEGEKFLVFSYRPFDGLQPYAEQGPIFLHAEPCEAYQADEKPEAPLSPLPPLPPVLEDSPRYMLRGYDQDQRIVYGSGTIADKEDIHDTARDMLKQSNIEFVHVRSATNNCWQARVDTASDQK